MCFSAQLPTTFVMEGVTMYITREAFVATLGFVACGGCAASLHLHRAGGPRPAGAVGRSACRAELRPHAEDRESPLTLMSGYATGEMHSFLGRHGLLLEQDACEDACLAYLRQHGRTGRGPGGDVIAAASGTSKVGGA